MSKSNDKLAGAVIGLVALVIALLAWLAPFSPVGPSPFSQTTLAPSGLVTATSVALAIPTPTDSFFPTPTKLATSTPTYPHITIKNKLVLPIRIYIDDTFKAEMGASMTKVFVLESFPVAVRWEIVKQPTGRAPIGDNLEETFLNIGDGQTIYVDNVINNQAYFYPIISNRTPQQCDVAVNSGWADENQTGAAVPANTDNVGFGYYRLYSNSNITLFCGDSKTMQWWGQRPGDTRGIQIMQYVTQDTGVAKFLLQP